MTSLVAITGGIGCGKSVVSRLLRTMGYAVYDCDNRARFLMNRDAELRRHLCDAFGPATYRTDGTLDREHLARYIFGNEEALQRMNSLVHPCVGRDLQEWHSRQTLTPAFYESAILFESGFDRFADRIWSVSAPLELRIARCMERDHCSREKIAARIGNQIPQEEKDRRADAVILNDPTHSLIDQVRKLLQML